MLSDAFSDHNLQQTKHSEPGWDLGGKVGPGPSPKRQARARSGQARPKTGRGINSREQINPAIRIKIHPIAKFDSQHEGVMHVRTAVVLDDGSAGAGSCRVYPQVVLPRYGAGRMACSGG